MNTIGLIGGMSWESTLTYYRYINEAIRTRVGGLSSAKVLLHSLDFSQVVSLQQQGNWHDAGTLLAKTAKGLQQAGADCVLICTNTMHLVAEQVEDEIDIPLLNIISATAYALKADGHQSALLLATKYTMEHGFYHQHMKLAGVHIVVPNEHDRNLLQRIIFDELCCGTISSNSRLELLRMIDLAREQGTDAVILGCTEIQLLISPNALPLPGYDSTQIHAKAAVDFALTSTRSIGKPGLS